MKIKLFAAVLALLTVISLAACGEFHLGATPKDSEPGSSDTNGADINGSETSEHVHVEEIIPAVYATSFSTGVTEGIRCTECGEILKSGEETPIVAPVDISFTAGTVTAEPTVVTTEHFRFEIPGNVYIIDGLWEKIDLVSSIMEEVSGLKFDGNPNYSTDLITVEVIKLTDTECELGPAYASFGCITVSSGDLVDFYAMIHEASHALHYNQSPWNYCIWAMEGISTYTTYKTQKYVQENYPELTPFVRTTNTSILNMGISNFDALYEHSMEYWMDHEFEYSGNSNYPIGFMLSWYLDETFGDYTKWILEYEKSNPFCEATNSYDILSKEEQLKAFKSVYGEDVFDNFYAWLKQNESILSAQHVDLSEAEYIQLYPQFTYSTIMYDITLGCQDATLAYKDLYVDFSAGKHYMTEYKGRSTDGMLLEFLCDGKAQVEFYDADGNLVKVKETQPADGKNTDSEFKLCESLDGISFVKLVGAGELRNISVIGFDSQYHK